MGAARTSSVSLSSRPRPSDSHARSTGRCGVRVTDRSRSASTAPAWPRSALGFRRTSGIGCCADTSIGHRRARADSVVEASSDALASVAERLTARYGDLLPAETIHRALHEAYDALQA